MLRYIKLLFRWIIEFFRSARLRRRRASGEARPFYIIGHRGSPCREIENTLESFETAVTRDGANALEMDLCFTLDRQVIVWHDWDPNDPIARLRESGAEPDVKYCCSYPEDSSQRRPVSELMLKDIRTCFGYVEKGTDRKCEAVHIPTLEEVLQWARTRPQLKLIFLDIKVPEEEEGLAEEMIDCVEALLRRYPPPCQIVYETPSSRVLQIIQDVAPERDYTLDIEVPPGFIIDPEEYSAVGPAIKRGNAWATPNRPRSVTFAPWVTLRRIVESDIRRRDRHNDSNARVPVKGIVPYTVNEPKEMRTLIALGVDGIQTDRPDILRAVAMTMGRAIA